MNEDMYSYYCFVCGEKVKGKHDCPEIVYTSENIATYEDKEKNKLKIIWNWIMKRIKR